tara:strand:+ start:928 stop:1377 length:450 start_codon:yes stop_codon:yes gene_type:complete
MKPVSKLRNIDYSLPMQLLQATKSATALFRTMLHSHELTDQQWRIIRVLANQKNIETFELSKKSMIPPPSLTRMLHNFEELGFVTRKSDPKDQRKTLVNLSSAGWKKFEQVAPEAEKVYFTIEKKVGKRELYEVLEKLQKLNANLRIEY